MSLQQYTETIARRYKQGNTTEHSFRGDLQQLIESLVPEAAATNEPKGQESGDPDYITRKFSKNNWLFLIDRPVTHRLIL